MVTPASFVAGAARVAIPPTEDDLTRGVYLGGYGGYRARRATGVLDAPEARALYVASGNAAVLFVALDLVGLHAGRLRQALRRVSSVTGLAGDAVFISCSHSHSSPDTQGIWGGAPAGYLARIMDAAVEAARTAHLRASPVTLRAASAEAAGLTYNRRGWSEVDTTLAVLQATGEGGAPIGTLVNFACHPTCIPADSTVVSRDFPGFLADRLDADLGGVTLFVNGPQGDVNPLKATGVDDARDLGEALASAALAALATADAVLPGLELTPRRPLLPVAPQALPSWGRRALGPLTPALRSLATSGALTRLADTLSRSGKRDAAQIAGAFAAMLPGMIAGRTGALLQTRVGLVRIGAEVAAITAPGEVVTRMGRPIRARLPGAHRFFLGLTHDTTGYLLPEDEWMAAPRGGYEETVGLGRAAGPAWQHVAEELLASSAQPRPA